MLVGLSGSVSSSVLKRLCMLWGVEVFVRTRIFTKTRCTHFRMNTGTEVLSRIFILSESESEASVFTSRQNHTAIVYWNAISDFQRYVPLFHYWIQI